MNATKPNPKQTQRITAACQYLVMFGATTPLDVVIAANMFNVPPITLVTVLQLAKIGEPMLDVFLENMAKTGSTEDDLMEQAAVFILDRTMQPVIQTLHALRSGQPFEKLTQVEIGALRQDGIKILRALGLVTLSEEEKQHETEKI